MSRLVHIIDDEEAIRDGLGWLLKTRGLDSRGWEDGAAFLAAGDAPLAGVTCLVLDVRMPEVSGLEVFDQLQARHGEAMPPVIFLTGHGDIPMAVEAVKKGAFDFFEKPLSNNRLVDRVIEALDRAEKSLALRSTQAETERRLAMLSPRELEVMERILVGKLNKVIADDLGITMRTVEVHRASIFNKMGVRGAVELAQLLKH